MLVESSYGLRLQLTADLVREAYRYGARDAQAATELAESSDSADAPLVSSVDPSDGTGCSHPSPP
jgi:hypothetical protein